MANFNQDNEVSALCHLLKDHEVASESQLEAYFDASVQEDVPFRKLIIREGLISEPELLELMAEDYRTAVVNLKDYEITEALVKRLPRNFVRLHKVFPFYDNDGVLCYVAKDPFNYQAIDEIEYVARSESQMYLALEADIEQAIEQYYPEFDDISDFAESQEIMDLNRSLEDEDIIDLDKIDEVGSSAPIKKFVNMVLMHGIKSRAADIHLEPFADMFRIRYRVDGALYEMSPPPKHLGPAIISRIKVMSNLNIAEKRVPQDGRIELQMMGKPIDLRVSTLPTQYGESVVMRILDRGVVNLQLEALGIGDKMMAEIREYINRPNGIMVVTGPTGSGKTTTLYSCLSEINTIEDKLLTAEDPVEYNIDGIMQVPINDAIGMTFAAALRSFLRQDPDRIMIGEIRDLETAQMAIQASLTGHLVLSTLHTNDAAGAVSRFIDMGVEPFLISSALASVLGQRLLRRICPNCRTAYTPKDEELQRLGITAEDIGGRNFYFGKGCDVCNQTGYKGRVGIYELLHVTPAIQLMINQRKPTAIIRNKAIEEGMVTMRQNGIRCILDGVTSVDEVLKYT